MQGILKRSLFTLGALAALSLSWFTFLKAAVPARSPVETTAREAVSSDPSVARRARGRLRAMGPDGLAALTSFHLDELNQLLAHEVDNVPFTPAEVRLSGAFDAVARQRDARRSRLFWFTDLEEARAFAAKTERPILSLRLLGRLDDELSCANSRFFRTTLYPNEPIADLLRNEWVLHWESVREVPRIVIDYGDGRVIERTITGNSLHHVLAADGTPVDVLPGIYGPGAFLEALKRAGEMARCVRALPLPERDQALARYHRERLAAITEERARDLARLGAPVTEQTRDADLQAAASFHLSEASVDDNSRALMKAKMRGVYEGEAIDRAIARFERNAAEDTLRNEWVFHQQISRWFVSAGGRQELAALTDRIYDELFLTPRRDPWLGLVPEEAYSGLDRDGRRNDGKVLGAPASADGTPLPSETDIRLGPPPSAGEAGLRAGPKARVEMPVVEQLLGHRSA